MILWQLAAGVVVVVVVVRSMMSNRQFLVTDMQQLFSTGNNDGSASLWHLRVYICTLI